MKNRKIFPPQINLNNSNNFKENKLLRNSNLLTYQNNKKVNYRNKVNNNYYFGVILK